MTTQVELRNAIWQACTAIRNEHRDVKKYVEYTAILLFFKFYDDVYDTLPADVRGLIPDDYRWRTLKGLDKQGFAAANPEVLIRLRAFFERRLWVGQGHFGIIFEHFGFDIKHPEVLGLALLALDKINFAGIAYDQKGDIYEFLISKMADAGVKGEFFTPRPIVDMVISVLKPRYGGRTWDLACGTAGFLSRAFEEMLADLKARYPEGTEDYERALTRLRYDSIYGNETESVSARLARMNMILRGDGHSTILEFNSLDQQTYTEDRLDIRGRLEPNPIPRIIAEDGGFDYIMANPPYGGSQAVSDVGAVFNPWQRSKKPEANFLQVMMHTLKPGGRCGVLMPEGILFRGEENKIRKRLLQDFDLQAVVGLFKGAFEFADVKACVLFFRKPLPEEKWQGTHDVWIAETRDVAGIEAIPTRFGSDAEDGMARMVGVDEIAQKNGVLRPSLYLAMVRDQNASDVPLSELFEETRNTLTVQDDQVYRQITVKLYGKGAVLRGEVAGSQIGTKNQKVASAGDLIVSKIDARNGALAVVPPALDGAIVTQDFPLFRPISERLSPRLFAYYLRYGPWTEQLNADAQGTTNRQRVTAADILALRAPCPTPEEQELILTRLDAQRGMSDRALALLAEASNLDWLDDAVFAVDPSDLLAPSFASLVEDASDYVEPHAHPSTEWVFCGVTTEEGVRTGSMKAGRDYPSDARVRRLHRGMLIYNPMRVNVGSIGLVTDATETSVTSPDYVTFRCKPDLDPRFALYLIKSPLFRRLIKQVEVGAVRPRLYLKTLAHIAVPIPRPERQGEIIHLIETQLAAYGHVRAIHDQAEEVMGRIVRDLFGVDRMPSRATPDPSGGGTDDQDRNATDQVVAQTVA